MASTAAQRSALMWDEACERRLRRVEACEAIRQLIARYAVGADRRNDPAILTPLFAEDAEWRADGLPTLVGREAIGEGLSALARTFVTWSLHYMVSPLIEVDAEGLTATCRWYLWELCTMEQGKSPGTDTWYGGWYDSELSLHDGVWLFDRVHLVPRIVSSAGMTWEGKVAG